MVGNTIGRFAIERELAATPLGAIYKAKDPQSGRLLALWTVRLDAAGAQEFLVRLKTYAKAASALKSPNIATIYGGGTDAGRFFIALEYVSATSLHDLLARGQRFSTSELIDLARQTCSALDHAQHRNVFHAALHPGNILVEMDGTAKIMDFGIPKDAPPADDERRCYLSPEQLAGTAPDLRSNLFSWGAMLYEMATGQKAFAGADRDAAPRAPHEVNAATPVGLSRAIMKALAKEPEERYQHGSELVAALENHKEDAKATPAVAPASAPKAPRPPQPSAYAAMPPVLPPAAPSSAPAVPKAAPAAPVVAPEAPPAVEHVYSGPAPGSPAEAAAPAKPAAVTRATKELKRAVHGAAVTLRAPETQTRVKQSLPSVVRVVAALAIVFFALAAYYFIDGQVEAWRARKASATVAAAPAPPPAPAPIVETPAPAVVAESEPEPESLEAAAEVAVARRKRPKAIPVAPVRAAPEVAAPTTGDAAINSIPDGAQVQIDGRSDPSWRTPLLAGNLAPGGHAIALTKPGYSPHYQTVQIEAGQRTTFVASLAEQGATVSVSSDPAGATIFLDGKDMGRVTPTKLVVGKGSHTVMLRKLGYFQFTADAQWAAGENAQVHAPLKPMGNVDDAKVAGKLSRFTGRPKEMASVQIRTRPKGGQVMINGRIMERTTPAEFFLPAGQYEVVVTAQGYRPLRKMLTVETASKTVIDEPLQK